LLQKKATPLATIRLGVAPSTTLPWESVDGRSTPRSAF